jgi:DNA-binding NarL/FixJ family response regulator
MGLKAVRRITFRTPPAQAAAIRVVVADGQELVRAGLRVLLEGESRLSVVGEAASGDEAILLTDQLRPDVVMIDERLPGIDCVQVTARISAKSEVGVMLLTASDSHERVLAALRAGARSALLKDTEPLLLVQAVEALARGEALLSPSLTRLLIAEFAARPEPTCPSAECLSELTAREREVVELVALGLTNDEIGERLVVTPATAKTHVSRAMIKLHARDRAKLVVFAYEAGLVVPRRDAAVRKSLPRLALA